VKVAQTSECLLSVESFVAYSVLRRLDQGSPTFLKLRAASAAIDAKGYEFDTHVPSVIR